MNKKGYTIPELIAVILIVGIIAVVGISKISYAFSEINNPELEKKEMNSLIKQASESYARSRKDEFKKSEDSYIYAKEVADAGFLFEKSEYNTIKVKITYDAESDIFKAEVIE